MRAERKALSVSALELAHAAWELGVPLSCTEVNRIEQAQRHPTPWHLHAWMEVLNLPQAKRWQLVREWARSPRWSGTVTSWSDWCQLLAGHDRPVPVTREARSGRLRQRPKGVVVGATFKLRLTAAEDTLLRQTAVFCKVTPSQLIRDSVFEAIAKRRKVVPRETSATRVASTNVRLELTPQALSSFRRVSYGLDFAAWARLIVLDDIETGRCVARYLPDTAAPPALAAEVAAVSA